MKIADAMPTPLVDASFKLHYMCPSFYEILIQSIGLNFRYLPSLIKLCRIKAELNGCFTSCYYDAIYWA